MTQLLEKAYKEAKKASPEVQDSIAEWILIELEGVPGIEQRGERMASALRKLAASGAFSEVADPVSWQREVREDRELPGRDG